MRWNEVFEGKYTKWVVDPKDAEQTPYDDIPEQEWDAMMSAYDYSEAPKHHQSRSQHIQDFESRPDKNVAPHEHKELNLLLAGKKPAALLPFLSSQAKEAIETGKIIMKPFNDSFVVALPAEQWRINKIISVLRTEPWNSDNQDRAFFMRDVKLGRLLGYTKEQIKSFVNR